MTTLVLAIHEKTVRLPLFRGVFVLRERFADVNRKGYITIAAALMLVGALSVYVGTIYWMMHAGFALQDGDRIRQEEGGEVLRLEIALRQQEAALFAGKDLRIQTMEKISSISFIGGDRENVAQAPEAFSSHRP